MNLREAIRARVAERAVEHQLHSLAGPIAHHAQLRIGLRVGEDPTGSVGQVGGRPLLPPGTPWPTDDDGPLVAWLSVELDKLPRHSPLPASGRLTFWLIPDRSPGPPDRPLDAIGGRVLWSPSEELESVDPPPGVPTLSPRCLWAGLETSLPASESVFVREPFVDAEALEESLWEREHELSDDELPPDTPITERYDALREAIRGPVTDPDARTEPLRDYATPTVIELLGHTAPCQDDPLLEHVVRSSDPPLSYPLGPAELAAAEERARGWRLLAQAGANRPLGFDILTGGMIYFLIPDADLAADKSRFDRVVAMVQR